MPISILELIYIGSQNRFTLLVLCLDPNRICYTHPNPETVSKRV